MKATCLIIFYFFFSHSIASNCFSNNSSSNPVQSLGTKHQPFVENGVNLIDLTDLQIRLMRACQHLPVEERNSLLTDSVYKPFSEVWEGYLGSESSFEKWVEGGAYPRLAYFEQKSTQFDRILIEESFYSSVARMAELTGLTTMGKWYMLFGPGWTNLGGLGNGVMVIDLANSANNRVEEIIRFFPHEINHQIYNKTFPRENNNKVLHRILDEGFACFVSYLYFEGKTTIAKELAYSESDYLACRENDAEIIDLLREHYNEIDEQLSRQFANRLHRFSDNVPGAIGYYLGFRIVEEFVKQNGQDSWKLIYSMDPELVLEKSKILDLYKR